MSDRGGCGLAARGTTDEASRQTLPPLETTTTTTTTTTTATVPIERFYTVQRGDILAVIAADRGVTVEAIVELNDLESADAIQAGQVLEIPANVREHDASLERSADPRSSMALSRVFGVPRLVVMSFWPTTDHWSVEIPLDTLHTRLDVLADTGVADADRCTVRRPLSPKLRVAGVHGTTVVRWRLLRCIKYDHEQNTSMCSITTSGTM